MKNIFAVLSLVLVGVVLYQHHQTIQIKSQLQRRTTQYNHLASEKSDLQSKHERIMLKFKNQLSIERFQYNAILADPFLYLKESADYRRAQRTQQKFYAITTAQTF